jgi:hypothetical protein
MKDERHSGDNADSSSRYLSTQILISATNLFEAGAIFDEISFVISKYVFPILLAFGVLNNILVIIVMSQDKYKAIVSCFYLRSLAIFDILNMVWFIQFHVHGVVSAGAGAFGDIFCVEVFMLLYFATTASNWRVKSGGGHPAYYCYMNLSVEHANTYTRVHSVLAYVAPSLLISMFNLGIFIKLRMHTADAVEVKAHSSKEEQMAMTMVMVASLVFIGLIFPYLLIVFFLDFSHLDTDLKTPYERKLTTLFIYVSVILYLLNIILNFYLYCVCCKKFRQDLFSMVSCFRNN